MPTPAEAEVTDQTDELEPGAELKEEGQQQEETKTKPEATDEMRAAMAELATTVTGLVKEKGGGKEKELTPDEINELWAVYDPEKGRPDFMKRFFKLNPEATQEEINEAKALWKDFQTGIVKQAITGARNYVSVDMRKLQDEMKEALDFVSEVKAERLQKAFHKEYPSLAEPKYAKIVQAQAKILASKEFKNQTEYFKELAEGSAEAIKELVPDFDLGKAKETKPAAKTQKLPRTTVGGGSSAGGSQLSELSPSDNQIDEIPLPV